MADSTDEIGIDRYYRSFSAGTTLYYAVDITNTGSEAVSAFYVDLYLDQSWSPEIGTDGDEYVDVTELKPGVTTFADFLVEVPTGCYPCDSWILVDSYNEVDETDETDNIGGPLEVYSW